jgi:hypothetical protein
MISAEVEAIAEPTEERAAEQTSGGGAIHIELPGRATFSVESGADQARVGSGKIMLNAGHRRREMQTS